MSEALAFAFFRAERRAQGWVTHGLDHVRFGHRYAVPGRAEPEGLYGGWRYRDGTLEAEVDRLGFCNLFYWQSADGLSISPSPLQLIAEGAPAALDDRALGVFLRIGLFLNQDTPFREIHVLPPGGRLVWKDGRMRVTGEARPEREVAISRERALEGFVDLTRQAVARARASSGREAIVPLSGGRDSRHLLFELERQGAPPVECVTYDHGGASCGAEVEAARRAAEAVGVPHRVLEAPRSRHRDVLRGLVLTHLCSDEHSQMLPLREYCRGRPLATVDGIAGDVLSRNGRFSDERAHELGRRGAFEAMARAQMAGHARVIGGASPVDLYGEAEARRRFPEDETVEYIARTIARFADTADPFSAYLFWNRTRREISLAPQGILADVDPVLCPYLDSDLVRFLGSLPFSVTRGGRFHDDAIAAAFPQHADLPYHDQLEATARVASPWARMRTLVQGYGVVARVAPRRLVPDALAMLGLGVARATRQGRDLLRFHQMCLVELDPGRARRLLRIAGRLDG